MNVIQERQSRRKSQINKIKESLTEIYLRSPELNYKTFLMGVMSGMNLSKRTATDYIEMALFESGLKINKKAGLLISI